VDAGDWAVKSLEVYRHFVTYLGSLVQHDEARQRLNLDWHSFDELLAAFNIRYLTKGLSSLRQLKDRSIDFWFSEAVLEHVRVDEFDATIRECFRVMRPGARGSHVVDDKDHLQAGLNNMRFARRTWEKPWMASSGFYTNRLRHSDVTASLKSAGFEVISDRPNRWTEIPIARQALAKEFRHYDDDTLRIREAAIVVEVPARAT
jgi:ubiquinone/menaquinone biosynthesis C-methylase UbiE